MSQATLAGIGHDLLVGRLGDEALLGLVEVALVLERQRGGDAFAQFDRERRRRIALRVEVLDLRWRKPHSGALGRAASRLNASEAKNATAALAATIKPGKGRRVFITRTPDSKNGNNHLSTHKLWSA